ncbi:unnamed protein product [Angiostrongylus costaricensis]|uniref:Uncharacterized protein n=1 Tax=Angiostrongylus costaricensis TaxID=334426 RepID=A0A0R3Q036_ANGCS|nr:unnamed protein product [Angiostrongylus costaricensis]
MFFVFLILLMILVVTFFVNGESTFNLWFWSKFGSDEERYFLDKTVWVIGCSSGIGAEIVLRLAQLDCNVILSARRKEELDALKESKIVYTIISRISIGRDKLPGAEEVLQKSKHFLRKGNFFTANVDVIILCCGQSQRAEWTTVDPKVDDACFQVNALGPTVLAREYLKTLKTDENGWNDSFIELAFIYDLGFTDSVE